MTQTKVEKPRDQINRLAQYIVHNVPGEPSQDEGAVDTAIRIMKEAFATIWELRGRQPHSLNHLAAEIHSTATEHGWWSEPRSFGDICALIHSEVSEALEEYRTGDAKVSATIYWSVIDDETGLDRDHPKPEGVAIELADVIIRVLDAAHQYGIDMDEAMRVKMSYNETRPFRHGGKVL